jgi:CelD/BcsL family acetyltransferase involved in cellulose biosynthesis
VTLIDAEVRPPLEPAARQFKVERFDGSDLAAAGWPAISAGPQLDMYVYQSREFLDVWMTTIGKARGAQCFLIVVKEADGTPAIFLPLAIESKFNVRILRFMDGGVTDFNAPILAVGRNFTRLEFMGIWSEILTLLPHVDVIDLQKIAGTVANSRNPLTYLDCVAYESSGHAIALNVWSEETAQDRSITRMRKKFRRQHERLGEFGVTDFLDNPQAPQLAWVVDSLVDLKRKQYLRTSGRDFFAAPGVSEFYREMTQPSRLGHISHLSALTCGDKVVSAHLGFLGHGRFYYVLPAFDTRYRSLAVGHLLLDHLIQHCTKGDFAFFDLGEGDFPYKRKWATHRLPLFSYEHALTTTGAVYRQLRRVRRAAGISNFSETYLNGRRRGSAVLNVAKACQRFGRARWTSATQRSARPRMRST